jgi:hypothetical protein
MMVIRFEPIPVEPALPERKKAAAAPKIERSTPIESPQQSLPYAKPAPLGKAKSRREKA